ncbi:energy-coupling factor ABC transporter permease [Vibrio sp. TH_r3]|uniref:energy-coupling factor ABC transporter permease n=1 Tax=Vibrio sp. TH_r3 TaxID=3082084 RepID=UPI0029559A2A|nr:energy-coupling factor ABC transporter permease [Vibrio sp. TH_r3]MDV7103020.1 energy-coupling factor ABC transporter permease [Vibrio sp. TH_r3]
MSGIQIVSFVTIICIAYYCLNDFKKFFLPKLIGDTPFQHFTFLTLLGLFLLWSAQAGVIEGLNVHFLGLTVITLIFGPRVAFILTVPVIIGLIITGQIQPLNSGQYLLFSSLLPILISYSIFIVSFHYLPKNIFIFIFIAGFLNGAITGSVHLVLNTLLQYFTHQYDWVIIKDNYLVLLPLLAFPEGLLNGMTAAILSVYRPEWLRLFSDKHYIYQQIKK